MVPSVQLEWTHLAKKLLLLPQLATASGIMGDPSANTIQHRRKMFREMTYRVGLGLTTCLGLCLLAASGLRGGVANLRAYPEYLRVDPFGQIVPADRATDRTQAAVVQQGQGQRSISLEGARGGYVSIHLVAELSGVEGYSLNLRFAAGNCGIQTDVYREWFHYVRSVKSYYPDALIPI
jgi:hypothetical protein